MDKIKAIVSADAKQRYDLVLESPEGLKLMVWGAQPASTQREGADAESAQASVVLTATTTVVEDPNGIWWIKARQGHSIKVRRVAFCSN